MRAVLVGLLVALVAAPGAVGARKLLVGVTEDGLKFEPAATRRDARALGIDAVRITLTWRPGRTQLSAEQRSELARATGGAGRLRVVLSVFGERAVYAPTSETRRREYCSFARSVVRRYRAIRDVVIWNEPNKEFFWQPQFERGRSVAPAAYAALLAECWDALHAERADVNVLAPSTAPRGNDEPAAPSNVSHSPVRFIEEMGRAYRRSGRDRPLFDTVAHHVHGSGAAERPWLRHAGRTVSQGDWARLVGALRRAFAGTAQPVPGRCVARRCTAIWYLEAGYQTRPDAAKQPLYTGAETERSPVADSVGPVDVSPLPPETSKAPDHASQVVAGVRLAYCQPYVEAFFNFLLWDQAELEGWQSGAYWVDRTPKDSFAAFRDVIRDAKQGRIRCDTVHEQLPDPEATLGRPPVAGSATATQPTASTPSAPTALAPATSTFAPTTATVTPPRGASTQPSAAATATPGSADAADDRVDARLAALGAVALLLVTGGTLAYVGGRGRRRRRSR